MAFGKQKSEQYKTVKEVCLKEKWWKDVLYSVYRIIKNVWIKKQINIRSADGKSLIECKERADRWQEYKEWL